MENIQKWGFGMAPLKPSTAQSNRKALAAVKNFVNGEGPTKPDTICEDISKVKGLFNRVVKQDQWDWFTVNMYFDYPTHKDLVSIVNALTLLRKAIIDKDNPLGEKALGLRKYENYRKDAAEGIFEYVRETEFPEDTSRLRCVYYCESEQEALNYARDDCLASGLFTKEQVILLEVEVDGNRVRRYDQSFFNLALKAIERNDIDAVFAYARKYFSCQRSDTPLIEVVADGSNSVLRSIAY